MLTYPLSIHALNMCRVYDFPRLTSFGFCIRICSLQLTPKGRWKRYWQRETIRLLFGRTRLLFRAFCIRYTPHSLYMIQLKMMVCYKESISFFGGLIFQLNHVTPPKPNMSPEKSWEWKTILLFWNGFLFRGHGGCSILGILIDNGLLF